MPFRLLHTADWHLGRIFFNVSLLDDQAHALEQVAEVARDTRADALVIAGDIYDRAVPPADAVRLLDETLKRLALDLNLAVVIIAGNHDSAERLGFGAALMEDRRCFVRGPLADPLAPITIDGRDGAARIFPLPYAEPALVRQVLGASDLHSHDAALGALVRRLGALPKDLPNIAVGHCFVGGGAVCESERPLSVGGAGQVSAAHFAGFDYVALGHLHRPQAFRSADGHERVQYSGSLLKYSFSEAAHEKSLSLVELGAGPPQVTRLALTPRRDLRIIEGYLTALLNGPPPGESADDYLLIRLLDRGALLDPMGRLRRAYPNALHLERPPLAQTGEGRGPNREQLARGDAALFADFFTQVTGQAPDNAQRDVLHGVLEALTRQEREATPAAAPRTAAGYRG
jgi:exonuclease SbcD